MKEGNPSYYNELAIAALTLSVISFIPLAGLEKSIPAIVFGIFALKELKQDPSQKGKNIVIAAIALGVVYTVYIFIMLPNIIEVMKKLATAI